MIQDLPLFIVCPMGAYLACCQGVGSRPQDLTPRSPSTQSHGTHVTLAFGRYEVLGTRRHLEHDLADGASFHRLVRLLRRLKGEPGT
jgi:hypothetical protein